MATNARHAPALSLMLSRPSKPAAAVVLLVLALVVGLFLTSTPDQPFVPLGVEGATSAGGTPAPGVALPDAETLRDGVGIAPAERSEIERGRRAGGSVRGIVLDADTL